jgi:hypothetical protein
VNYLHILPVLCRSAGGDPWKQWRKLIGCALESPVGWYSSMVAESSAFFPQLPINSGPIVWYRHSYDGRVVVHISSKNGKTSYAMFEVKSLFRGSVFHPYPVVKSINLQSGASERFFIIRICNTNGQTSLRQNWKGALTHDVCLGIKRTWDAWYSKSMMLDRTCDCPHLTRLTILHYRNQPALWKYCNICREDT